MLLDEDINPLQIIANGIRCETYTLIEWFDEHPKYVNIFISGLGTTLHFIGFSRFHQWQIIKTLVTEFLPQEMLDEQDKIALQQVMDNDRPFTDIFIIAEFYPNYPNEEVDKCLIRYLAKTRQNFHRIGTGTVADYLSHIIFCLVSLRLREMGYTDAYLDKDTPFNETDVGIVRPMIERLEQLINETRKALKQQLESVK